MANIKPQRANRYPSPILSLVRKVEAAIDWLDLEFTTLKPHNGGKLKEKLGASHVTPLNPGPGDYATRFVARFQDPGPLAQVHQRLRDAGAALEQGVFVRSIEIAFDLYAHGNAMPTLAQFAAHLYRFAVMVADAENHRIVNELGGKKIIKRAQAGPQEFLAGWTQYVGNQGSDDIPPDPVSQRIYVKTIDQGQGLPPEQHRARYEITLTRSGLPFTTLEQAAAFRFETLAPWFKWRMLKPGLDSLQLAAVSACPQIGSRRVVKLHRGGQRAFDLRTAADTELNTQAREALRALTRRVHRGWRRMKASEKSNEPQLISSDFQEPKWPARRERAEGFSDNCSSSPLHRQVSEDQDSLTKLLADLAQAHHQGNDHHQEEQDEDQGYDWNSIMELAALFEDPRERSQAPACA